MGNFSPNNTGNGASRPAYSGPRRQPVDTSTLPTAEGVVRDLNMWEKSFGDVYEIIFEDGTKFEQSRTPPKCAEGDTVRFKFSTNDRGYHHIKGPITVVAAAGATPARAAAASVPAAAPAADPQTRFTRSNIEPRASKDDRYYEWDEKKQLCISYQAARNSVLEMLPMLERQGAMLEYAKSDSAKQKREKFMAFFNKLVHEFHTAALAAGGIVKPEAVDSGDNMGGEAAKAAGDETWEDRGVEE